MKNNANQQRIIPLTDDFMKDKKVNDKVYAYLQINSYLTDDKRRFCYKDDKLSIKTIHSNISRTIKKSNGKTTKDISESTIRNTIKLYYKLGLIYDSIITDKYGNKVVVTILSQSFEYFSYIPLPTLKYLVDTSNNNVIKIYAYLLNKYNWKCREKGIYNFTLKELCNEVGYTERAENTLIMRNIIQSLKNNGLIVFKEGYYISNDNLPIPNFQLLNVSLYVR